jgi:hypothetical protein
MDNDKLIESLHKLSAEQLGKLIEKRRAEDRALNVLWRAARAREREERRQQRDAELEERARLIREGKANGREASSAR